MHIKTLTKVAPEKAFNIELILDLFLQAINLIEALERLLGIDISAKDFVPGPNNPPQ